MPRSPSVLLIVRGGGLLGFDHCPRFLRLLNFPRHQLLRFPRPHLLLHRSNLTCYISSAFSLARHHRPLPNHGNVHFHLAGISHVITQKKRYSHLVCPFPNFVLVKFPNPNGSSLHLGEQSFLDLTIQVVLNLDDVLDEIFLKCDEWCTYSGKMEAYSFLFRIPRSSTSGGRSGVVILQIPLDGWHDVPGNVPLVLVQIIPQPCLDISERPSCFQQAGVDLIHTIRVKR